MNDLNATYIEHRRLPNFDDVESLKVDLGHGVVVLDLLLDPNLLLWKASRKLALVLGNVVGKKFLDKSMNYFINGNFKGPIGYKSATSFY